MIYLQVNLLSSLKQKELFQCKSCDMSCAMLEPLSKILTSMKFIDLLVCNSITMAQLITLHLAMRVMVTCLLFENGRLDATPFNWL